MNYICIEAIEDKAVFTNDGTLQAGIHYWIEDATNGTGAQRRTRELLISEYWKAGVHPKYGGDPYSDFRDCLKRDLGEGFDKFVYADLIQDGKTLRPVIYEVKNKDEIPQRILDDPHLKEMVRGRLKSCGNYTKKQNMNFIDKLIADMVVNGVNSKRFQEIIGGLND